MSDWYDHTTYPANGASLSSSALRSELEAIDTAFQKLPTLTGNGGKYVAINTGGTAMETVTGIDISDVAGMAAGVSTFLANPTSAYLLAAVTDETGSGNLVFSTGPTLVAPRLGTPFSGVLTNCTALPLTTGVTGTLAVTNGGTGVTTSTGTGSVVLGTSPTLTGARLSGYTSFYPPRFVNGAGATHTIDLSLGIIQMVLLNDNCTFTMPATTGGEMFFLLLMQDATGSRVPTFPGVIWPGGAAPTFTTTPASQDLVLFICPYIGTNWHAVRIGADMR